MTELERAMLFKAVDLIERRLVKTADSFTKPFESLSEYQRGIVYAIRAAQELLRDEAKK